jgi:hypothetical protein
MKLRSKRDSLRRFAQCRIAFDKKVPLLRALTLLACAGFLTGCVANRSSPAALGFSAQQSYDPKALEHGFPGYEAVLAFIARREGLPHDRHALFEIAADSELKRHYPAAVGELVVVRPDYRGGGRYPYGVRGAQGQGRYYAFRVTNLEWTLVGIFHGNQLRWELIGDTIRVFAHWHTSAFDDPADDLSYVWNGRFFELEAQPDNEMETGTGPPDH